MWHTFSQQAVIRSQPFDDFLLKNQQQRCTTLLRYPEKFTILSINNYFLIVIVQRRTDFGISKGHQPENVDERLSYNAYEESSIRSCYCSFSVDSRFKLCTTKSFQYVLACTRRRFVL
ncbi:unnamed protein product [Caenorhabditis brenneri]